MQISAQISLYPLRQKKLSPIIEEAWEILGGFSMDIKKGEMSTVVRGEAEKVFAAIQKVFLNSAEKGPISMVVIFSNACPI